LGFGARKTSKVFFGSKKRRLKKLIKNFVKKRDLENKAKV
jgi:hypothetical protein